MRMMPIVGALILIVALSGCGVKVRHPTATQETFDKDLYECLKEVAGLSGASSTVTAYRLGNTAVVSGGSSGVPNCGMVFACLKVKGYQTSALWQKRQYTVNTSRVCQY